ncbi:MAG: 5'/3'-nucleotidase SurE [Bacteroidales bacterium]
MLKNSKKLILVTNDDGFQANGIKSLTEVASEFGEVVVVAPEKSQSGMSHSVSLSSPLFLNKHHSNNGYKIYSCSGTPADCVKIAIHKVLERKPDLVISGINHGSNASVSAIYSGTLAAAREGSLNGIPSIGFSLLNYSADADFTVSAHFASIIIQKVFENGIPEQTCLNVNIPDLELAEIKGIKICRQTRGKWVEEFDQRHTPSKREYYWLTGQFDNFEPHATDTDEWALANNYVAVVPVEVDLTSYHVLNELKKWNF